MITKASPSANSVGCRGADLGTEITNPRIIASGSKAAGQPFSGSASTSNQTPEAKSSPSPSPFAN